MNLLLRILLDQQGVALSMTRKTANTLITAAGFNTNWTEIEAVINALDADNLADGAVSAIKLNADVIRATYGLKQHTDGSLQVDLSDTNPALELTDGGLRLKVKTGLLSRGADGADWGRTADILLTGAATTPDGFADVSATYEGKMIRVSATALSTGGSDTHTTPSHILTLAEIPAITLTVPHNTTGAGSANGIHSALYDGANTSPITTSSTGSGGGHTHSEADNVPCYMTLRMCQKN